MSYSFGMFFVECKPEEVLEKCLSITRTIISDAKYIISENEFYMPSHRHNIKETHIAREFDHTWLYELFTHKFVYWEKYNLLGLSGYDYGEKTGNLFTKHIDFQNSTDQNYDYSEWQGIVCFDKVISNINCMDKSQLLDSLNEGKDYIAYTEEDIDDELYYKQTLVYKKIYDMLNLDSWLYGGEGNFKRITMCGIDTWELFMKLSTLMHQI